MIRFPVCQHCRGVCTGAGERCSSSYLYASVSHHEAAAFPVHEDLGGLYRRPAAPRLEHAERHHSSVRRPHRQLDLARSRDLPHLLIRFFATRGDEIMYDMMRDFAKNIFFVYVYVVYYFEVSSLVRETSSFEGGQEARGVCVPKPKKGFEKPK